VIEARKCPSCGSERSSSLGEVRKTMDHRFSNEPFSIVECAPCDLLYLGQELSKQDFVHMYEDSVQFAGSYREEETIRGAKQYYGGCYVQLLADIGIDASQAKVLEAGAGRAWMCMVAADVGKALTVAQDVSPECATECDWVDKYVVGEITDPEIAARAPYDIISLTHVIEHVPAPVEFMAILKRLLQPRGRMFITAPHRPQDWSKGSPISVWESWSYNHVPGHLQYFSERAMRVAARAAGLQLVRWSLHEDGQAFEAILAHQ